MAARPGAWRARLALLAAGWLATSAAGAQAPRRRAPPVVAEDDAPPPPAWRWHQILASQRIGGRLTSIAVHPARPEQIYVGTEEGTVVRSDDGGVTWQEFELGPFVVQHRSIGVQVPNDPMAIHAPQAHIGALHPSLVTARVAPTATPFANHFIIGYTPFAPGISLLFPPSSVPLQQTLLGNVLRSRQGETIPVVRIALCPGGDNPLLVATTRELLASIDEGLSFVRLLVVPDNFPIRNVACSPDNPNDIVLASDMALFRSTDGGVTFNESPNGTPPGGASAVAFSAWRTRTGVSELLMAAGASLFIGDPDSETGLEFSYPDFEDMSNAPYEDVTWIDTSPTGQVWLATGDGIRMSPDGGQHWDNPLRALFDRQPIRQVAVGANEDGGERVVALSRDLGFATDDGGRTWHPFFQGITRRSFVQMAALPPEPGVPPRWWIVTGGEVWATVSPQLADLAEGDPEAARWARARLRRTPPMRAALEAAFAHNQLSVAHIVGLVNAQRNRALIPHLSLTFTGGDSRQAILRTRMPIDPVTAMGQANGISWGVFLNATWFLPEVTYQDPTGISSDLYELRRQIGFAVEDAWHERMIHLRRLAGGLSDRLQVQILRTRIEVLEVALEQWLGRPIWDVGTGREGAQGGR